jgi:hypothetical protein
VPGTCSTAPVWPISACAGVPGAAIGETISAPLCLLKSDYLPGPEQDTAMRAFCRRRLQIETTFSTLDATFHLKCPRARTYRGLFTRLAAKVTAYNIALAANCLLGHISFAFFNPLA